MKTIFHHIDRVKEKPHHVRKRIAFTIAGAGAGFVALVWMAVSLSTGAFAIQGSTFAQSTGQEPGLTTSVKNPNVAGAAAALDSANAPARIEIVNVAPAQQKKQAEQTTIPF